MTRVLKGVGGMKVVFEGRIEWRWRGSNSGWRAGNFFKKNEFQIVEMAGVVMMLMDINDELNDEENEFERIAAGI